MSPTLLDLVAVRRHLEKRLLCSLPSAGEFVAFSFDDGPSPRNTPTLLELLAKHDCQATFFLVGRRARAYPELVRQIVEAGHEIGNHGYHHLPLLLLPDAWIRAELERTERAIVDASGVRPTYFRPPMGWINRRVLGVATEMGYQPVLGDVHPEDSRQPSAETIVERVRTRIGPGSILLLHDGGWRATADRAQTLRAVELLLTELLPELGFQRGSVGQLIRRPEAVEGL